MNTKLCPMRPYESSKTKEAGSKVAPVVSVMTTTEFSECIEDQCAWYDSRFKMCGILSLAKSFD